MSGSNGSGDRMAGDEGPSLFCSTEDEPSEKFKSEHRKVSLHEMRQLPFSCAGERSGGFAGVFG